MSAGIALLLLLASQAGAWGFTPHPVCTLFHDDPALALRVTYDPEQAEAYAIRLTRPAADWPDAPAFALRFDGGTRPMTIATDRHRLSEGGRTLQVTDTGFGNVLDGIEFNATATALAGDTAIPVPLAGAAPAVRAFRACVKGAPGLS